jgi:rhamnulokinase
MPLSTKLLAIDLGAESGRGILGSFDGNHVVLDVLYRFPNGPTRLGDRLYWDALRLFDEIKTAIGKGAEQGPLASVGVDTWGIDFALLGHGDELLSNPRHYRDPHTETIMARAFEIMPAREIFARTGIQFMRFNTLFQLLALKQAGSSAFSAAQKLLFMPDLFHSWLSGNTCNEATITSTSQCYDPTKKQWAEPVLDTFEMPRHFFGNIVPAGTKLGALLPDIAKETGAGAVPVIAPASHDTASAVAAVPAQGDDWCYLSSGTWSLMGVELTKPVINEKVQAANFTNEGGVHGTIRFLKNIMGMWLIQGCRRSLAQHATLTSYEELVVLANQAPAFQSLINPDDESFVLPSDMHAAIVDYCRKTGQPAPNNPGQFIRCCLESLALRYRWTAEKLEELTGRKIRVIHIVGGGCQNRLLNQFTADATGRLVQAGPTEATALGNLLTQAIGLGLIHSLKEGREIVRQSCTLESFEPTRSESWDGPYQRFKQLLTDNK